MNSVQIEQYLSFLGLSSQLSQRDWLLAATPEPFRRRNVFVSGSVLDNKYDLQHTFDAKPK